MTEKESGSATVRPVLSDNWWFWSAIAALTGIAVLGNARYRASAAHLRTIALRRRLVEPGAGRRIDTRAGDFGSDLSWLSILLGLWVAASPWIWGYDDVHGAVTTDVVTGTAAVVLTAAGIVFPSLNALTVLAGLWLVIAPWIVGYGDEGGPVGLSDTLTGVVIAALGIAALAAAAKRIVPGESMPIGRVRRSVAPNTENERRP
jgi:SPW repeat